MNRAGAGRKARLGAVIIISMAVWGAGCQRQPDEFDPHPFHELERANVNRHPIPEKRPLPSEELEPARRQDPTPRPVGGPRGVAVRMSLREIIQRAVANNTDVRVASYDPGIEEARVVEQEARFDPNFFIRGSYETQYAISPTSGFFPSGDPFDPSVFRTLSGATGFSQLLPSGGEAEISYRAQRIQRVPEGVVDPYYTSDVVLRITQPLLRDFGTEINRARITIARNNQRISILEFRRTLEELLTDLERTYWQIVQAQREVSFQQALLRRTIDTYNILYERAREGVDVSRIQVSTARQSVESRRAVLLRARSRVGDLSDQLKRLMNDADFPVAGEQIILPAHGALLEPIDFDLQEQINTALENRPELAQQLARIDSARITERVARNNELPQLNATGGVTFHGVGEDLGEALDTQDTFDFISSNIGLEFQIPIGNRAALAISRRARLQRLQAIEQYRNLVSQVALDVSTSLREVNTSWNEIVVRRRARVAAQDALDAIQDRKRAGEPLTPTFVQFELDTQQQLTNAQAEEAGAIADYNVSIALLERAKGTLLRYDNVIMQEEARR